MNISIWMYACLHIHIHAYHWDLNWWSVIVKLHGFQVTYICIYIYMYICMYIYIYIYMNISIWMYTCLHIHIHEYTYTDIVAAAVIIAIIASIVAYWILFRLLALFPRLELLRFDYMCFIYLYQYIYIYLYPYIYIHLYPYIYIHLYPYIYMSVSYLRM
jgi:hypothetical protein